MASGGLKCVSFYGRKTPPPTTMTPMVCFEIVLPFQAHLFLAKAVTIVIIVVVVAVAAAAAAVVVVAVAEETESLVQVIAGSLWGHGCDACGGVCARRYPMLPLTVARLPQRLEGATRLAPQWKHGVRA